MMAACTHTGASLSCLRSAGEWPFSIRTWLWASDMGVIRGDSPLFCLHTFSGKCRQKLTGEKDAIDGHIITGPVAWAVEWTRDYWGVGWDFESHCVIGFYASKEEAEARAAMVDPDDPDVKRYSDFSEGVRQVKPYELRGNRRMRPEQVWACLLCAQALSDVVHAVFDTKVRSWSSLYISG